MLITYLDFKAVIFFLVQLHGLSQGKLKNYLNLQGEIARSPAAAAETHTTNSGTARERDR